MPKRVAETAHVSELSDAELEEIIREGKELAYFASREASPLGALEETSSQCRCGSKASM